jgi:tetratricopeptide (TPR) repeat protein
MLRRRSVGIGWMMAGIVVALGLAGAAFRSSHPSAARPSPSTPPGSIVTSREGLASTVAEMTARLKDLPTDSAAAVRLAEALLRQARVLNHAGLPLRAEAALDIVIGADPSDYLARRMRSMVYLAAHRFHDAIREAERCRALRGDAPWIDGVVGDASLELGNQDAAFAAFDRMMARRPDASAYARASYARELQGDLEGAIALMSMAGSATSAHDPESQAWHAAQLGYLYLLSGDNQSARRESERAEAFFPGHPFATTGLARVDLADGRPADALARLVPILDESGTASDFALAGDIYSALSRPDEAERHHRLAEAIRVSTEGIR